MKGKINSEFVYSLIYYAIAVATAKHSAWAYSTTMEGLEPKIDWATVGFNIAGAWSIGGLVIWFMWGLLAAMAVDVGMFLVAKQIREAKNRNLLGLYLTYAMVALISAYFQVMYALQHAAQFTPVEGVPIWVNTAYLWRFLIVPVSLPLMSVGYTLFTRIDEAKNKATIGTVDKELGTKTYTADEAAQFTGYSPAWVRDRFYRSEKGGLKSGETFGQRDENGKMFFTHEELVPFKRENR